MMIGKNYRILILLNVQGAYDRSVLKGILNYARFNTSWIFLREAPYYKLQKNKENLIRQIIKWQPDGIIMCENSSTDEIISLNIPTIISPFTKIFPQVINIVADDYAIGEMGAEYFLDKKYKHFAYYGTKDSFWSIERKKAFVLTLKKKGFNVSCLESSSENKNFNWEYEPYNIADWLKQLPLPLALMSCADDWSQLVVEAAKILKLRIPEDIAVLGVDNDELICELSNPPLSSIKQDSEIIGFESAYLLDQIIRGKKVPVKNIVGAPINIYVRQSTDILAVTDANLIKALNFIKENAAKRPINVDDVVKVTHLSRRVLEKKFKQVIGSSIGNKIKSIRIYSICEKLLNTNLSIEEIAYVMGFNSCANFSSYFRREKKVSPSVYRNMHSISNSGRIKE